MSKSGSRRKFLRDSLSAGSGAAAAGFYSTLLACTQAVADNGANKAMNLEHKEFLSKLIESSEVLDPRALWALKDGGDGDKYGGVLEEETAKKK